MKNEIAVLFNDSVTEQGIKDIIAKHDPKVIRNMESDVEFKEARKVRAEMNKLVDKIDRVGIDAANQVKEMREDLKARIESAYSPTVTPFLIENQKRKDEKKKLEDKKKARIAEQEAKIDDIKGSSNRAMHLPIDDLESILQGVCDIDLSWFDDDFRGGAQIAKEVAIGQLNDAFKYLNEKEETRKANEIKDAEMADKNDEIEKLKAMIEAMQPAKEKEPAQKHKPTLEDELKNWLIETDIDAYNYNLLVRIIVRFTTLDITE